MLLNLSQPLFLSFLLLAIKIKQSQSLVEVTITPINEDESLVELTDSFTHSERPERSDTFSTFKSQSSDEQMSTDPPQQMVNEASQAENIPTSSICNSLEKYSLLVPDLKNCSRYYQVCSQSSRLSHVQVASLNLSDAKSCIEGTLFDGLDGQCVKNGKAYCGLYKCEEPEGLYPDPTSKNSLIHCIDGFPQRVLCKPKETVFMNGSKSCIWPPGELPFTLKLFQAFIRFVKYTEPNPDLIDINTTSGDQVYSTEYFIKAGVLAALVPLMYIFTIVYLFKQCNGGAKYTKSSCFSPGANEFAHRYYRRPTRNSAAVNLQLHPLTFQPRRHGFRDSYFVTSRF